MATVTSVAVERSGPEIRAALAEHAPDDEPRFTAELCTALHRAGENLDLAGPQAVLTRWHALATMAANPLTADEQAQLARARAGDFTGWTANPDFAESQADSARGTGIEDVDPTAAVNPPANPAAC